MTLRTYFNASRFLEYGEGGLREVPLLFALLLGFWSALGFGHGKPCHESVLRDIQK